jgi:hypothetical protein
MPSPFNPESAPALNLSSGAYPPKTIIHIVMTPTKPARTAPETISIASCFAIFIPNKTVDVLSLFYSVLHNSQTDSGDLFLMICG